MGALSSRRENEFTLPSPFCSVWAHKGVDDASQVGEGPSALLSLPIQMLIYSGNPSWTLPEIMF